MFKDKWLKVKKHGKNTINALLIVGAAYHAVSRLHYFSNHVALQVHPPIARTQFLKDTGIEIRGFRIKDEEKTLMRFLEAVKNEGITKNEMPKIVLETDKYFEKTLFGQLSSTILNPYAGAYNAITKTVTMNDNDEKTLIHEIKHAKTFAHPKYDELIREWRNVSELNGESPYMSIFEQLASRIRFISDIVPKKAWSDTSGFISNYSTTHHIEDI